jgi:uncharacterized protein YyaL (SSP411 family)
MGEAKSRGTFQERQREAILRKEKEREERYKEKIERERNLTPEEREEREKRKRDNIRMAQWLGLAGGFGAYPYYLRGRRF